MTLPVNKSWIISTEINESTEVDKYHHIYLGIDFGTSTTVVSQAKLADSKAHIKTLAISQPKDMGGTVEHYLVNSVLAWSNKKLIWGQDAYRLKPRLKDGANVFSSFKMKLGLSIGPTYPKTFLTSKRNHTVTVETAEDATREFFKGVLTSVNKTFNTDNTDNYKFTFTVPASFEANQRRALIKSLEENGITEDQLALVDEPNAAFLSFLYECTHQNPDHPFLKRLRENDARIAVYDFGAGTCDVSVLQINIAEDNFKSQNLAISRFTALGGDNIDRAIAQEVLIPQILQSYPAYDPSLKDREDILIPSLQATAERLKIYVGKWMVENDISSIDQFQNHQDVIFRDQPITPIKIRKEYELHLKTPTLTLDQFENVMEGFVGYYDDARTPMHIVSPIADAIDKSGLHKEDIDAVLFIGGSCENPLVQSCIKEYLNEYGENVEAILPSNLRSHVSLGAAIHSFSYHGLDVDFIQPITSETISIITKNDFLETIIPASSPVPNPSIFETTLVVAKHNQRSIELPICVGNKNKILGLMTINAPGKAFKYGDEVKVNASINQEKLLSITATIAGVTVTSDILNPLANEELSEADTRLLKAKQQFNQDLLNFQGRPRLHVVKKYATEALEAGAYELAAELFQGIERLDSSQNHATNICYAYGRAHRSNLSDEWAKTAYKRNPSAVTAYNLSLRFQGKEREEYLREALKHDPNFTSALILLGKQLGIKKDDEGSQLLNRAKDNLYEESSSSSFTIKNCETLIDVSSLLEDQYTKNEAEEILEQLNAKKDSSIYSNKNLVQAICSEQPLINNG